MIINAAHRSARLLMTLAGVTVILLALFTAGARLTLPLVANYKGVLEARVSDYLESPVDIGKLSLSWQGTGPILRAQDVAVLESHERRVSLDELLIDVNLARSVLRGIPIINELTLVGASLAIEADAAGQLRVHGMESVRTSVGDDTDGAAGDELNQPAAVTAGKRKGVDILAWLLNARRVGLLDTQVSLIDVQSGRTLVVEDLNIRAENTGEVHQLRVELKLPDELGGSLEAGIDLSGQADSLADSDGDLYLRAERLEVRTLAELLGAIDLVDIDRNAAASIDTSLSMELWGRWEQGQLVSVHGPLSTGAIVDSRSGKSLLQGMSAMFALAASADSTTVNIDEVTLAGAVGESRIDTLSLTWDKGALRTPRNWMLEARGTQLNLGSVTALPATILSQRTPWLADFLQQSQMGGWLRDWYVRAGSQADGPTLTASADLDGLRMKPVGSLPSLGPIDGRVDIQELQGQISLSADSMPLQWPAYTAHSLQLDTLKAAIMLDASDLRRVQIGADLALQDQGIETSTRLKATLVPGQSPHLDAQTRYSVVDLNALKPWLPRRMLPGFSRWMDRAVESGSASDGSALFFGRLADFPFHDGDGVFRASVDIDQGTLAYLPNWPAFEDIDGTLELNALMLTGHANNARLGEFDIPHTQFRIDNLLAPVLQLDSTGRGRLQNIVDFGNQGPLSPFLEPVLNDVTGSGNADMDLSLAVQLFRSRQKNSPAAQNTPTRPFSVDGSLFLKDNELAFGRANMALSRVSGAIGFDQHGIRINDLRAHALDQPVVINARTEGQGQAAVTGISISGALSASEVLAHYGSPLDQFVRGTSSWTLELNAPHSTRRMVQEGLGMQMRSDLVGTALLLPKPYDKGTASARSIELDTAFIPGRTGQQWQIRYADQLHAVARMGRDKLQSLHVHVGAGSLPQPLIDSEEAGIRIQGGGDTIALDGWVESIADFIQSIPGDGSAPEPVLPVSAELEFDSLQIGTRTLGPVRVRMNSDRTYLNAVLQNRSVSGSVRYPREYWSRKTAMKVRVENIDSSLVTALASRPPADRVMGEDNELDPRLLPAIDARFGKVVYGKYVLRDVVMKAQPDVGGLTLTTLGFAYQSMQLVGQGYWRLKDPQGVNPALAGQHMTSLNLVLQTDDFGQGLQSIGVDNVISEGEGGIEAQLSWPGPLYLPGLSELDGHVKVLMERGSIIPLEPGAGRMVGLFALQALPRRLELDFKDMTADGLAFKRITGDISIENGVSNVSLVQLTGPIGVVDITGSSDLNTRQFDQHITVLPRVSAALPIIGVISGGASAGIGVLVAAGFLKAVGIDLDRIGLREYSLTGSWDDPVFKAVEFADQQRQ
ncbi:MAG: TIGR02099 family protein [Granulosicoccus sp.]|nr:TIGR02099 family protein [Granulosicoccus sp.]